METYQVLETRLAAWSNRPHTVAVSSGTAALHLALEVLRLPVGSKVAVPDFTMIACPRAVALAGLEPVFIDCLDDLTMDPEALATACEAEDVSALMTVHVYGRRTRGEVYDQATHYGLPVIEDLAEAHGVPPHPRAFASCWSFYKNKIIAGEEGGAVAFGGGAEADLARSLRSLGFTQAHDFRHVPRGHNYRMSNLHAAEVLKGLTLYADNYAIRRSVEMAWDEKCPRHWRQPSREAPWVYDLRMRGNGTVGLDRAVSGLQAIGVPARHAFKPMSTQPEFISCERYGRHGRAVIASAEVLYVPLTPLKADKIREAYAVLTDILDPDF